MATQAAASRVAAASHRVGVDAAVVAQAVRVPNGATAAAGTSAVRLKRASAATRHGEQARAGAITDEGVAHVTTAHAVAASDVEAVAAQAAALATSATGEKGATMATRKRGTVTTRYQGECGLACAGAGAGCAAVRATATHTATLHEERPAKLRKAEAIGSTRQLRAGKSMPLGKACRPTEQDVLLCHSGWRYAEQDMVKAYAGFTTIGGRWMGGLFADCDIKQGNVIGRYRGLKISRAASDKLTGTGRGQYLMDTPRVGGAGEEVTITIDGAPRAHRPNVMGFANFSGAPNAAFHCDRWFERSPAHGELSNVLVQACEDIEEGTEIRVNYDVGGGEERSFREHLERLGVTSAELDDDAYKRKVWQRPSRACKTTKERAATGAFLGRNRSRERSRGRTA